MVEKQPPWALSGILESRRSHVHKYDIPQCLPRSWFPAQAQAVQHAIDATLARFLPEHTHNRDTDNSVSCLAFFKAHDSSFRSADDCDTPVYLPYSVHQNRTLLGAQRATFGHLETRRLDAVGAAIGRHEGRKS